MRFTLMILFVLFSLTLAPIGVYAVPPVDCSRKIDITPELLTKQAIVLGEIHGTNEIPQFAADLVCNLLAARGGKGVVLALEYPRSEQSALDKFMLSKGSPDDLNKLVGGSFWAVKSAFGVTSRSMANLIWTMRSLRAKGHDVKILAFDDSEKAWGQSSISKEEFGREIDRLMATFLGQSINQAFGKMHIVLAGGYHATTRRENVFDPNHRAMAHLLSKEFQIVALSASYVSGEAWACRMMNPADQAPKCGALTVIGRSLPKEAPWRIGLYETASEREAAGFDGFFVVGKISASPPAQAAHRGNRPPNASIINLR